MYRKNQYNKVEKQVEEYVVHKENGIETKISDITYNKAQIYKIFEGSDQQDVLISFYADNVKVPAEGCKIFLRFKASKDQNKGHVYYAASATKENKPKQFNGNITRLNDSPNEIGAYYLWKSKDIDDDKNLVDFYNVIERHTKDNLCDWLKEDMKNRFLFRINELNA